MKTIEMLLVAAALSGTMVVAAQMPDNVAEPSKGGETLSHGALSAVLIASRSATNPPVAGSSEEQLRSRHEGNEPGMVRLNFRDAPLDTVLDYLAEAVGFTIVREVNPRGTLTAWSGQPVSISEALDLLDAALLRNGYAAIRQDRTLTVVSRDEAKTRQIPVRLGSDPQSIPATGEVVTQIIPVGFSEVGPLVKNLQNVVSTRTVMTADDSANAIVVTDTQANVRRLAEIIKAIDAGAEDFTVVKVRRLKNADPAETVDLLSSLFPDQGRTDQGQMPTQFGGGPPAPGGFGFGPPGAGTTGGQSTTNSRLKKGAKVVAVADPRTASIVLSAPRDLIGQVEQVVDELDKDPARKQRVAMFQLKNASSQSAMQVLQDLFQKNSAANTRSTSTLNDALDNRRTSQTQSSQSNGYSRSGTLGAGGGLGGGTGGLGGGGPGQ
jgi:general secretion pathway protein D